MGKLKEKIIEKGSGLVAKSKLKTIRKDITKTFGQTNLKKVGKGVESITSKAIDLWNKFKK